MNDATKRAVTRALDNTLRAVVIQEYRRLYLYQKRKGRKISDRVNYAVKELDKLRHGGFPNYYDGWVALFYYWYQPRQINLAYSLITSEAVGGITSDRLRVIDFGCGALAMQFGVALAAADALERGQRISEIRIDSLDKSRAMLNMGNELWEQFKVEMLANTDTDLKYVKQACEIIKSRITPLSQRTLLDERLAESRDWAKDWRSECWISSLHAVYEGYENDVPQWLKYLTKEFSHAPRLFLMTTHKNKAHLLTKALPKGTNQTIRPRFIWHPWAFDKITQWGKNLNTDPSIHGDGYLDTNVAWKVSNPVARTY